MSAINSKGLQIYMTKGKNTPTDLVPTAITSAHPAVVTVAAVTGLSVGDLVTFTGTRMAALDGKTVPIGKIDPAANTFEVLADTTGQTFTPGSAKASVIHVADMVKLCLSNVTTNPETPGTVSVGTYCEPTASLPSTVVSAGSITLDGYVDKADDGYLELLVAETDAQRRWVDVILPGDQGHIVFPVTLSTVTFGFPLDGAITFTAQGALGSKPVHLFSPT